MRLDPMSRSGSPGPKIGRIDLPGGGIEAYQPVLTELRRQQGEPDRFCVGVEKQQEMIIGDRPAHRIEFGDCVTVEEYHHAAGEAGVPIRLVHLCCIRLVPQNVAELALTAVLRITAEEPPAPEYRMSLAQADGRCGERQQVLLVGG